MSALTKTTRRDSDIQSLLSNENAYGTRGTAIRQKRVHLTGSSDFVAIHYPPRGPFEMIEIVPSGEDLKRNLELADRQRDETSNSRSTTQIAGPVGGLWAERMDKSFEIPEWFEAPDFGEPDWSMSFIPPTSRERVEAVVTSVRRGKFFVPSFED